MHYIVHYVDSRGQEASKKVEAPSKQDARWVSGVPERRIVSVSDDYLGQLAERFKPPGPEVKNQAIFLQALSSSIATGKTVRQAVEQQVANSTWLKAPEDKLEKCENLADYMQLFRFDRFAILLAKTAEKTGQHAQALRQSSEYLLGQERVKTEVQGELRTGITYIVLGLTFLLFIPVFIGKSLRQIQSSNSIELQANEFTHYLTGFGSVIENYWYLLVVLLIMGFLYRKPIWAGLKKLPYFRLYHDKKLYLRGLRFLSAYKMLHESGCVDKEIILELLQSSDGADRDVYQKIYAHLCRSEDLQLAFHEEDWSLSVRDGMSVIGEMDTEQQSSMLAALLETTQMESVHATRKISKGLSRIGFVLMIFSVLAAVFGFYIPIITSVSSTL